MGTPLPPLVITPGIDCPICFGAGQTFPYPTPKFITIQFWDWTEGAFWNEIYRDELENPQVMAQLPLEPCRYLAQSANMDWLWWWGDPVDFCRIGFDVILDPLCFNALIGPPCKQIMDNEIVDPAGVITFGGYATVTFGAPE